MHSISTGGRLDTEQASKLPVPMVARERSAVAFHSARHVDPIIGSEDHELVALFDRFLDLLNLASRRFGHLFPYNRLRATAVEQVAAGAVAARVTRREAPLPNGTYPLTLDRGDLVRARRVGARSANIVWPIDRGVLEDAAARPWVYLAYPERFSFAWFSANSIGPRRLD